MYSFCTSIKMYKIVIASIFINTFAVAFPQNTKIDFLRDFFDKRNVKLNFITNWDAGTRIDILSENLINDRPKIVRFLNNTNDLTFEDFLIIDLECEELLIILQNIAVNKNNNQHVIIRKQQFLILTNNLCLDLTVENNFTSGFNVLFFAIETNTGYQLLKRNENVHSEYIHYGTWEIFNGLILNTTTEKSCNFHRQEFDIAVVLSNPDSLHHLEDYSSPWIDTYTKQSFSTLMRLFDYCNITPRFVPLADYNHFYRNHSYLLTASTPYLTEEVLKYVDVLYVQNGPKVCYLMMRPPTSFMTTIFTVALADSVWLATIAMLGLLSICYYFILNIEGRRKKIKEQEKFTVSDLALIAMEAICQQGTTVDPRSFSGRILALVMFLTLMFVYVSYSTNILILLQSTSEITDTEQLHNLEISFGGMDTESFLQYNFEKDVGVKMYSIDNSSLHSITGGMEKMKEGYFAYYVESPYAYKYANEKYTSYDICGIHEIAGDIDKRLGYISVPKNSKYLQILKSALLLMTELGFQSRDYQRHFYKPTCFSRGSSFAPIRLTDTYQLIYLVAFGIIGSLLILGLEFFIKKKIEKRGLKQ